MTTIKLGMPNLGFSGDSLASRGSAGLSAGAPVLWQFIFDATATNAQKRFYRAITENAAPANPDPQHLVWIKSGIFTMGGPVNEDYRQADEGPLTLVTINQSFWMSKYETTQEGARLIIVDPVQV